MLVFTVFNKTSAILSINGFGKISPYSSVVINTTVDSSEAMIKILRAMEKARLISWRSNEDGVIDDKDKINTIPPITGYKVTNMYMDAVTGKLIVEFDNN